MGHNRYSCTVQASSVSGQNNVDDTFIQIQAATGVTLYISSAKVMTSWGTDTAAFDTGYRVKMCRLSAVGSGTTVAGTVIKTDANIPASTSTVTAKSGSNLFTTGTIADTIILNGWFWHGGWQWIASDPDDMITTDAGGIFALVVSDPGPISNITAQCEWQEV